MREFLRLYGARALSLKIRERERESEISLKIKVVLYAKSVDGGGQNLREAHFERPFLSTLIGHIGNTWKQCQNVFRQAFRTWKLKSIIGTENKLHYTALHSNAE